MKSYEKKKRIIEIYDLMAENIEFMAREMFSEPESYISSEYANVPNVSNETKKVVKEAARLILDEIKSRRLEIYKLK